ncbi:anaphase promoting complex subunit [Saccharomycopsis crataegensis]|uniref:Anaphase promoting complex subunit n=1 Tax=Saccharomycopsis crataegensis TaxID=43959 RepID=A0AAV5QVU1_9ASCO|nr:anaphase promoting complex subunit [Saccharomycopsis crataegensis]
MNRSNASGSFRDSIEDHLNGSGVVMDDHDEGHVIDEENEDEEEEEDDDEEEEDDEEDEKDEEILSDADMKEEYYDRLRKIEAQGLVDIGNLALWTLSSYKPGCGLQELRADSPETYWQSDGVQPHHLNIHFNKRVQIKQISIFINYFLDESYTPSKIMILAGNGSHNLKEVTTIEINEPVGWTNIEFGDARHDGILKTLFIRVVVIANHQNGKDTHIRALKLFSPISNTSFDIITNKNEQNIPQNPELSNIPFSSVKFLSESQIR